MTPQARVEQHLAIVKHEAAEATRRLLAADRTKSALSLLVERIFSYDEQTKAALVAALPRAPHCLPVCKPGCAFCCHLSVFAAVPEILFLAEHLRRTLDAQALALVTSRIVEAAKAVADLSQEEHARARPMCPLLEPHANACTVYAARPLACRAYNSCDAAVCADAFAGRQLRWNLPVDLFQLTVTRNVRAGLLDGIAALGLDPGPYELAPGLAVALRVPDAAERWLAGEPVFAEAETRIGRERRGERSASLARGR